MKNIIIKYKKKRIKIQNVKKLSELGKMRGLMFRRREKCPALLFEFKKPVKMKIHSLFVFFPFIAAWTDNKNRIVDLKIVKPFRPIISSRKPFYKLIEIPLNKKYLTLSSVIVGAKKDLKR